MVRSVAWLYFEKKNEIPGKKTVTCTVCKLNQPFSGNTTNMFPHLRLKHPVLYPKKTKTTRMPNRPIGLLKDEDHENEEVMSDIYQEDDGIDSDSTVIHESRHATTDCQPSTSRHRSSEQESSSSSSVCYRSALSTTQILQHL
ncbi:hypothetical protein DAPPUDRAFT_303599 [Daphnia pulex]|uniref:BED-type domain-containing protein n=1 Tax=Daphnia pulex TaxID=6669 RepID=E9GGV6_DAPPU|nr:hypothetical protein DAPPUDRAFT_303599 [Daphnia pulex]|eukprot:EFX81291.1 hypothetical protein DAPPUDRAFT_303599 [Daphnia pulex]